MRYQVLNGDGEVVNTVVVDHLLAEGEVPSWFHLVYPADYTLRLEPTPEEA